MELALDAARSRRRSTRLALVLLVARRSPRCCCATSRAASWRWPLQGLLLVASGVGGRAGSGEPHAWLAAGADARRQGRRDPAGPAAALARVRLRREVDPVLPDRLAFLLGGRAGAARLPRGRPLGVCPAAPRRRRRAAGRAGAAAARAAHDGHAPQGALAGRRAGDDRERHLPGRAGRDPRLPLAVELAIAFDVLVGVLVMGS